MLRRLSIRNFAIIERLELELSDGLSVLSGETGAGKSIIVGALNLVMGARATGDLIRTGCDRADVAAVFDVPKAPEALSILDQLGIDVGDELLLRREVRNEGRNRAWINDQPVSITALGDLAQLLVDISGQHHNQTLLKVDNHLLLLDASAGLDQERTRMAEAHAALLALVREKRQLEHAAARRVERQEYLRFQLNELERAKIKPNEEDELENERNLLANAEKLQGALAQVHGLLDGDGGVLSALVQCRKAFAQLDRIEKAKDFSSRLESARLELEDIAHGVEDLSSFAEADPKRLDAIESRLALLQRLCKKHGGTTTDLLEKQRTITDELARIDSLDDELKKLDSDIAAASEAALAQARALSKKRIKAAKMLSERIENELGGLGMDKTRFAVDVQPRVSRDEHDIQSGERVISASGIDDVEFLLSPNVGEDLRPLAKIASGGELSRVMLAIKTVLLATDPVQCTVFDEVDAGIGGAIAQKVGEKIRQLAAARQVICITHLPQIAAFTDHHFMVEKHAREGRTFTTVNQLRENDRKERELARMMAGSAAGSASLEAARELIRHARGA